MFNVPSVSFGFVSGTMLDFSDVLNRDEEHIDLVVAPADLTGPDIAALNIIKLKELRVRTPESGHFCLLFGTFDSHNIRGSDKMARKSRFMMESKSF